MSEMIAYKDNGNKGDSILCSSQEEITRLRETRVEMQRLCLSAQRELEYLRQIRAVAERYQKETGVKARSQAHQIIFQARLTSQKEIKEIVELKRKTNDEIKQLLADFCTLRNAAMAVLEAQRKFVDAARIRSLSPELLEKTGGRSKGGGGVSVAGDESSLLEEEPLDEVGNQVSEEAARKSVGVS